MNAEINPVAKERSGEAELTKPSWVQRPQGRFLSHCGAKGLSNYARGGDQVERCNHHALGRVTIHAGLGGAVASALPVVAILGVGSGGV